MAANSSENGMVSATMMAPRTLPRKRKRMTDTRTIPAVRLRSTVSTVNLTRSERSRKGTILTPGQYSGVVFVSVELADLFVDAFQHRVGVGALLQQHDAFHGVGIVDDVAVGQVSGFADLAEANLGALRHGGDILDADAVPLAVLTRYSQCLAQWCKGPATAR